MTHPSATAVACSNFALCKYWGKSDQARNLPAVPSLSMTVSGLTTRTTVELDTDATEDATWLQGRRADAGTAARVVEHLERLRRHAGRGERMCVRSENSFPTGAGLASSASAFAALTAAAARALGIDASSDDLSDLARQASASAARSVHGGFVELPAAPAGTERLVARPVPVASGFEVRMLVVVTSESPKPIASRRGMNETARTSPYYPAWLEQAPAEHERARAALAIGDFVTLGEVMERSALRMHASAMAAVPPLLYWTSATVDAIAAVRRLRESGVGAYFTIDAGPSVKVLCRAEDVVAARSALESVRGALRVLLAEPGPAVQVID